ncbi:hypothetical protein ABZT03_00450 [Streptomyces sp. NPDC005574]
MLTDWFTRTTGLAHAYIEELRGQDTERPGRDVALVRGPLVELAPPPVR